VLSCVPSLSLSLSLFSASALECSANVTEIAKARKLIDVHGHGIMGLSEPN
jgi:hypothetical protein